MIIFAMAVSDDSRWDAWCGDFDEVEHEVFALFHTRWMWRAITGLMANGVPNRQYVVVQNYFIRTYVGTVCTAIRREADMDSRTSSLARCLQALIDCPHFATRSRFIALANTEREASGSAVLEREIAESFGRFAPNGSGCIDPAVPQEALNRLVTAAAPVRKYTNKVLAHRERNGVVEELTPTWDEINGALDEVGRVTKQFYGLRHPGQLLGNLTPVMGLQFTEMFRVPWYSEHWKAPEDVDQL